MFKKKKKAPSVKIPASVLKKEAEKAAKKMLAAERKKEQKKLAREKGKQIAAAKIAKHKQEEEHWNEFFDDKMKHEFAGGACFVSALILLALFFSGADFSQTVTQFFRNIFGVGMWLLPAFLIGFGVAFFTRPQMILPPKRVAALIVFWATLYGILNLLVEKNEGLALSHNYGGDLGFAISYFPRLLFGDFVTAVFFVGMLLLSAIPAFGIQFSRFFIRKKDDIDVEDNATKSKKNSKVEAGSAAPTPARHFKNELEIVDSTGKSQQGKPPKTKPTAPQDINLQKSDTEAELTEAKNREIKGQWQPPELDILKESHSTIVVNEKELRQKAEKIREKLEQFGIEVNMKSVHVGPTVTQFTLEPSAGVKLTKITALKNDLALTLAAENVRIEAPIRGKSLVGIEIPNAKRAIVGMREILESDVWNDNDQDLRLALGRDVAGKPVVVGLAKMPHLLIAGKTGAGKSVAMNTFLCSLLWHYSPEDLKLILVDPKRVELKPYDKLPHLLTPVIVEPEKCVSALAWAVAEMNRRYKALSEVGCRNLEEYNAKFSDDKEPFIVIVIDELADLMMVAGKDVEAAICRIAQLARAVGMHLVVATQRPSVDVVTGLIKANLPSRISFKVSSGIDSRTIIDQVGAEDLLGFGDMLYVDGNSGNLTRIQGIYIANDEIERITNHIKLQFPEMIANDEITNHSIEGMAKGGVLTAGVSGGDDDENLDDRFEEAVDLILQSGKASASFMQRQMEIGYARAARILDQMERKGIIGPARGAKPREIFGRPE